MNDENAMSRDELARIVFGAVERASPTGSGLITAEEP